jgi:hypothetical protein
MATQSQKYSLAMAGEFFVAAQLQRLGASASVTYGNAKRADVVAISKATNQAVIVEVKTSSAGSWPIGSRVPLPSPQLWVFVHLSLTNTAAPEYYVIDQTELHRLLAPSEQAYFAQYQAKHGVAYGDKPGVAKATRAALTPYRDNWQAIMRHL